MGSEPIEGIEGLTEVAREVGGVGTAVSERARREGEAAVTSGRSEVPDRGEASAEGGG